MKQTKRQLWGWHCQLEDLIGQGSILAVLLANDIKKFYVINGPAIEQIRKELNGLRREWCEVDGEGKFRHNNDGQLLLKPGREQQSFQLALKEFFDLPHEQAPALKLYHKLPN